jgi:hypothetical protein
MNAIRNIPDKQQYRLLECFWESQVTSKGWLINTITSLNLVQNGNVYIFGGWYGILASLIKDEFDYTKVYSIDIDASCKYFSEIHNIDNRISFITFDMKDYQYNDSNIGIIINTSTEHITQETFDAWMANVPNNIPIILQGNNFYDCEEHIRCTDTLDDFKRINPLKKYIYTGELTCYGPNGPFTRFMSIGYKNDY